MRINYTFNMIRNKQSSPHSLFSLFPLSSISMFKHSCFSHKLICDHTRLLACENSFGFCQQAGAGTFAKYLRSNLWEHFSLAVSYDGQKKDQASCLLFLILCPQIYILGWLECNLKLKVLWCFSAQHTSKEHLIELPLDFLEILASSCSLISHIQMFQPAEPYVFFL